MKKRRLTKEFTFMGMRFNKNDLLIITDTSFICIYSQNNDGINLPICIEINFKERYMADHEIDTYKKMFMENSVEDNLI